MLRRIMSLVLSFGLLFQQVSFAQVAVELNIANHLARIGSSMAQEKFRPLHLRYFSYDSLNDNFKVLLDKGDLKNLKAPELESRSKVLLSYFLIGVTLPDEAFWVNLRPDSESRIIDPWLEKTDIGKILLEADLQLKKDTALFTSPQTPEGRIYWNKLYKKAEELYGYDNVTIPTLTRPWIVPGEIIVRESKDSAYVYKATLKILLEEDYLKSTENRVQSTGYDFNDPRQKALNEYSSQLIRELIIPKLTREVNSSKRYAALRQVYYSLILSRWFKLRFTGKTGTYASLINTRNLANLTSQEAWSKTGYFKQYRKSFSDGEYNVKEPVHTPTGQVIRSYFSGGINVANGAINTQNGIILPNDNAAKLGEVVGGKAVVDPQGISLKPAAAGSPVREGQGNPSVGTYGTFWPAKEIAAAVEKGINGISLAIERHEKRIDELSQVIADERKKPVNEQGNRKIEEYEKEIEGRQAVIKKMQDALGSVHGRVSAQNGYAEAPLKKAVERLNNAGFSDIADILIGLYPVVLPYLIIRQDESPVHHIAHVVNFMTEIVIGERNIGDNKISSRDDIKRGVIAALLHDIGISESFLPKITEEMIEEAKKERGVSEEQIAALRQKAIKSRREHMEAGVALSRGILEAYNSKKGRSVFSPDDISEILRIVEKHDNSKIPYLESDVNQHKKWLITPEDKDWLMQLHWEADALWMFSEDGILVDLQRQKQENTPVNRKNKFDYNFGLHHQYVNPFRGVYDDKGMEKFGFKEGLLYRSVTGYGIAKRLEAQALSFAQEAAAAGETVKLVSSPVRLANAAGAPLSSVIKGEVDEIGKEIEKEKGKRIGKEGIAYQRPSNLEEMFTSLPEDARRAKWASDLNKRLNELFEKMRGVKGLDEDVFVSVANAYTFIIEYSPDIIGTVNLLENALLESKIESASTDHYKFYELASFVLSDIVRKGWGLEEGTEAIKALESVLITPNLDPAVYHYTLFGLSTLTDPDSLGLVDDLKRMLSYSHRLDPYAREFIRDTLRQWGAASSPVENSGEELASLAVNINVEMYKEQLRPILQGVNKNINVLDEIKRLDKEGKLSQIFPVMDVLRNKPKYVTKVFVHILRAIEELELIEKGDMNGFSSRIEEWRKGWPENTFTWKFEGKEGEDLFNKYRQIFQDLTRTPEDRELLYLVALLHDVGEQVKTQGHPNESARMIEPWLKQLGLSQEQIDRVRSVIRSHVDLGTLYFAERTPGYLNSSPESLNIDLKSQKGQEYIKTLSLLTFIDAGEAIVGKKAEFYAEVGNNPKYLDELKNNFYERRKKLFSSKADEKIDDGKYAKVNEELDKLEKLLTRGEMEDFIEDINSGIEVIDYCIFFCRGLRGDSLVKMLFIMHRLFKGKGIKRINLTAPSGMAPKVAVMIDKDILENWDLKDITELSPEDLIKELEKKGLAVRYTEGQLFIYNLEYYNAASSPIKSTPENTGGIGSRAIAAVDPQGISLKPAAAGSPVENSISSPADNRARVSAKLEEIKKNSGLPIAIVFPEPTTRFSDNTLWSKALGALYFDKDVYRRVESVDIKDKDNKVTREGEITTGELEDKGAGINTPLINNLGRKYDVRAGDFKSIRLGSDFKPKPSEDGEIPGLLMDRDTKVTPEAYFMHRGVFASKEDILKAFYGDNKLRFDITIIPPALWGNEYAKTVGHYHDPVDKPEIYQVVSGEVLWLMQKNENFRDPNSKIADFIAVKAKAGDIIIMLPGYGHVSVNISETEPLVMADWLTWHQKSYYGSFAEKGGAAYYVIRNEEGQPELKLNPKYAPPKRTRQMAAKDRISDFGLERGEPIYNLVKLSDKDFNGKVRFLYHPNEYGKLLTPEATLDEVKPEEKIRVASSPLGEYEARYQEILNMARAYEVRHFESGLVAHGPGEASFELDQNGFNNVFKAIDAVVMQIKDKINNPDAKNFITELAGILEDLTRLKVFVGTVTTSYDHHSMPMHDYDDRYDCAEPVRIKAKEALDQVRQLIEKQGPGGSAGSPMKSTSENTGGIGSRAIATVDPQGISLKPAAAGSPVRLANSSPSSVIKGEIDEIGKEIEKEKGKRIGKEGIAYQRPSNLEEMFASLPEDARRAKWASDLNKRLNELFKKMRGVKGLDEDAFVSVANAYTFIIEYSPDIIDTVSLLENALLESKIESASTDYYKFYELASFVLSDIVRKGWGLEEGTEAIKALESVLITPNLDPAVYHYTLFGLSTLTDPDSLGLVDDLKRMLSYSHRLDPYAREFIRDTLSQWGAASSPVEKAQGEEFSAGSPIEIGSYLAAIKEPINLVVGGNREGVDERSKAFIGKLVEAIALGNIGKIIVGEDPQGIDMELIALMVEKGYANKLIIVGIDNERRVTNEWWLTNYISRNNLTREQVNSYLRAIGINRDISALGRGDIERHLSSKGVSLEAVAQVETSGMSPQEKHRQKGISMVNRLGKGDLVAWVWTRPGEPDSATFKHAGSKGLNRVIFRQQESKAEFIPLVNAQKKAKVEKLHNELTDILASGKFPAKLDTQVNDSDGPVYIFLTNSSINKELWDSDEKYREAYIKLDKLRLGLFNLLLNHKNITVVFGDPRLEKEEYYNYVSTSEEDSTFTHNGYRANQAEVWMYRRYLNLVKEGNVPQGLITMVSSYGGSSYHRVLYPSDLADPISLSNSGSIEDVSGEFVSKVINIAGHKNWPQGAAGQVQQVRRLTYKDLPITLINLRVDVQGQINPNPRYSMRDRWIVENLADITIAFHDGLSPSVNWNFEQSLAQDKPSILATYRDYRSKDSLGVYNDKEYLNQEKKSGVVDPSGALASIAAPQQSPSTPSVVVPTGQNIDVAHFFTNATKVVFGGNREYIGSEEIRYTKEWAKIFARLDNIKEVYVGEDDEGLDRLLVDKLVGLGKGAKLRVIGINNNWRLASGRKSQLENQGVKFISVPSSRIVGLPIRLQHRQRGLYMIEQLVPQNPVVWVGTQYGPVDSAAFEYAARELKLPWILYLSKSGKVTTSSSPINDEDDNWVDISYKRDYERQQLEEEKENKRREDEEERRLPEVSDNTLSDHHLWGAAFMAMPLLEAARIFASGGVASSAVELVNPYSAFSIPLISDKDTLRAIENHMLLVQAGKMYKNGKALVDRYAALTNWIWTDLLRDKDVIGLGLHQEKLGLTARYNAALKARDFETARQTLQRYVVIRDLLCQRWLSLAIDAENGKTGLPPYAYEYAKKAFHNKDYELVAKLYGRYGDNLAKMSLYTWEPIAGLVEKAKAREIALFPLGAGGPGANIIAVSEHGADYIKKFLEENGISQIDEDKARAIIHGDEKYRGQEVEFKGYLPFKIGMEPMRINGFDKLKQFGINLSGRPEEGVFDQRTGQARELMPQETIDPSDINLVKGLLFMTSIDQRTGKHINFDQGKPLDASWIKSRIRLNAAQVREILRFARDNDIELEIVAHLRGVDGCGSSLDLPEFQLDLTKEKARMIVDFPSTPTIASDFEVAIRFELADNPEAIEYIAPDYTYSSKYIIEEYQNKAIDRDRPYVSQGEIGLMQDGKTPNGQLDAPAFIFRNIFGLKGVKIICDKMSPMAMAGGMESSNAFNVALIAAASMLSGANLNYAEIFNLAVKLENDEFNGLTGGQGHLSSMLGGAYQHIWLSGVKAEYKSAASPIVEKARRELLPEARRFIEFLGKTELEGQAEAFSREDAGKVNPVILALGSPSPEAFKQAALDWKKYTEKWGFPMVDVIASTGRGRGYKNFVLMTLEFFRREDVANGTDYEERFREKYGDEIEKAKTQDVNSLDAEYYSRPGKLNPDAFVYTEENINYENSFVEQHPIPATTLTEAKVIAFIMEMYAGPEIRKYIKLEELSNNTYDNIYKSMKIIEDMQGGFGDGNPMKIQLVAASFHKLRALLAAISICKEGDKRNSFLRSNFRDKDKQITGYTDKRAKMYDDWLITAEDSEGADLDAMSEETLESYLIQSIGLEYDPDRGRGGDMDRIRELYDNGVLAEHSEKVKRAFSKGGEWEKEKIIVLRQKLLAYITVRKSANAASPAKGESAASPAQTPPNDTMGGIDLRALTVNIQPMGSFKGLNFQLPKLSRARLSQANVNEEITAVKNMIKSGIVPSGERVKELVVVCAQKGEMSSYAGRLLLCLADILKLEEENASESSPQLREALAIVDSQG